MNGPIEVVLIVAAIGYVLLRRMTGEPAEAKRMLILPLVLTAIGFSDLSKVAHSATATVFLAVAAGIGVVIGAARGASVRLSVRDGIVFLRYTWLTIGLWVLNLAVKFGANAGLALIGKQTDSALSNSLMSTLGLGLLMEGVVVLGRALRTEGQIVWAKGKDGMPHRTSPFLDDLQGRMGGRRDGRY